MERWFPCTLFLLLFWEGGWLLYRKTISASRGSRENHLTGAERLFSPFTFHFSRWEWWLDFPTVAWWAGCALWETISGCAGRYPCCAWTIFSCGAAERYPRAGARGRGARGKDKPGWVGVPTPAGVKECLFSFTGLFVYALRVAPSLASIAFLACSNTALKASGLAMASSDRDLRSRSMLAALRPSMKRE